MSEAESAQTTSPELTIPREKMPPLYLHAAAVSRRAQKQFFTMLGIELVMLPLSVLVGAFSGSIDRIGPVSLIAPPFTMGSIHIPALTFFRIAQAVLLVFALLTRVIRLLARPELHWYEARAVAESVKSIAWRYMVGGEPFQEALADQALTDVVNDRFNGIRADISKYQAPDVVAERHQITPEMRAIRAAPLPARKRLYCRERVDEQLQWYKKNARFNRVRGLEAHFALILVEIFASAAVLLPMALAALHIFPLDLQSVATNIAGGGAAWMQAKRYEDLNASYKVTASELKQVVADINKQLDESDESAWARFVENAEGSMSREHQLWRATRIDD